MPRPYLDQIQGVVAVQELRVQSAALFPFEEPHRVVDQLGPQGGRVAERGLDEGLVGDVKVAEIRPATDIVWVARNLEGGYTKNSRKARKTRKRNRCVCAWSLVPHSEPEPVVPP